MKNLILEIVDGAENVIHRQVNMHISDKEIDEIGRRIVDFFGAAYYRTFDYPGEQKEVNKDEG